PVGEDLFVDANDQLLQDEAEMLPVVIRTPRGEFHAEIDPTQPTTVNIPTPKGSKKKWQPFFITEIFENRTRSGTAKPPSDPTPSTSALSIKMKLPVEPSSYAEAIKSSEAEFWQEAMAEEFASQEANNSWEVVDCPEGAKLLDTKWVYKIKKRPDGSLD